MAVLLVDGQPQRTLQLFRLAKIVMHAVAEGRAIQIDDTLIAVGEIALIDGEGKVTRTQQARHGGVILLRQARRIELRVAAHRTRAGDVGNHQPDRTIARGLQREDTLIFQGAGQQCREGQHLRQHPRHDGGIIVTAQDFIGQRAQPDQASAQALRLDLERQDAVVCGCGATRHGVVTHDT